MCVRAEIKIQKLRVASLELTLPQDQQHSLNVLSYCILVFCTFCYHISFQLLSFSLLFSAKHFTFTVPKINRACEVTDLVQGFGFYALHQEELAIPCVYF